MGTENKSVNENNLEQYGVWVKIKSDGVSGLTGNSPPPGHDSGSEILLDPLADTGVMDSSKNMENITAPSAFPSESINEEESQNEISALDFDALLEIEDSMTSTENQDEIVNLEDFEDFDVTADAEDLDTPDGQDEIVNLEDFEDFDVTADAEDLDTPDGQDEIVNLEDFEDFDVTADAEDLDAPDGQDESVDLEDFEDFDAAADAEDLDAPDGQDESVDLEDFEDFDAAADAEDLDTPDGQDESVDLEDFEDFDAAADAEDLDTPDGQDESVDLVDLKDFEDFDAAADTEDLDAPDGQDESVDIENFEDFDAAADAEDLDTPDGQDESVDLVDLKDFEDFDAAADTEDLDAPDGQDESVDIENFEDFDAAADAEDLDTPDGQDESVDLVDLKDFEDFDAAADTEDLDAPDGQDKLVDLKDFEDFDAAAEAEGIDAEAGNEIEKDDATSVVHKMISAIHKIEKKLDLLREDISQLSSISENRIPAEAQTPPQENEQTKGFFDEDEGDETIALTNDEFDTILEAEGLTEKIEEVSEEVSDIGNGDIETVELEGESFIDTIEEDIDNARLGDDVFIGQTADEIALSDDLDIETMEIEEDSDVSILVPQAESDSDTDLKTIEIDTEFNEGSQDQADSHDEEAARMDISDESSIDDSSDDAVFRDVGNIELDNIMKFTISSEESDADSIELESGIASKQGNDADISLEMNDDSPKDDADFSASIEEDDNNEISINLNVQEFDSPSPETSFQLEGETEDISGIMSALEDSRNIDLPIIEDEEEGNMNAPVESESTPIPGAMDQKSIKETLNYMDSLLEFLPNSKYKEFVRSEYFEMFSKMLKESGASE